MKIYKDGIFKTIDAKDFGVFQETGWVKAVKEEKQVIEQAPIIEEHIEELVINKPKVKKAK